MNDISYLLIAIGFGVLAWLTRDVSRALRNRKVRKMFERDDD